MAKGQAPKCMVYKETDLIELGQNIEKLITELDGFHPSEELLLAAQALRQRIEAQDQKDSPPTHP